MSKVRKLGILLVALMVGLTFATGGALAQDIDDDDENTNVNVQDADQEAFVDQDARTSVNNAAAGDDVEAETEQNAYVNQEVDQDSDQDIDDNDVNVGLDL